MRKINKLIAAIIIASTIFVGAATNRDALKDAEDSADLPTANALEAPNKAFSAIKGEAQRRSYLRSYAALRAEVAAEQARLAEIKRVKQIALAAEITRKRLEAAKTKAVKSVSRSNAYVGRAQTYEATFYTAYCPSGCIGVTASGYDVSSTIYYDGMRILAAPKHIPLYSIMRVTLADGSAFDAIVLDRGGDIGAGRIDILVKTRDEAYKLGRQSVQVSLIRKGR